MNTLTPNQSYYYNKHIKDFNDDFTYKEYQKMGIRFGQAIYNYFYGTIFHEPYPELFYCTDNKKSCGMFYKDLLEYVRVTYV